MEVFGWHSQQFLPKLHSCSQQRVGKLWMWCSCCLSKMELGIRLFNGDVVTFILHDGSLLSNRCASAIFGCDDHAVPPSPRSKLCDAQADPPEWHFSLQRRVGLASFFSTTGVQALDAMFMLFLQNEFFLLDACCSPKKEFGSSTMAVPPQWQDVVVVNLWSFLLLNGGCAIFGCGFEVVPP